MISYAICMCVPCTLGGVDYLAARSPLEDTERPTVLRYTPPNSARGLGLEVEVTVEFSEPVFWGPATRLKPYEPLDIGLSGARAYRPPKGWYKRYIRVKNRPCRCYIGTV